MGAESTIPPTDRREGIRPPDDPRYPPQSVTRPAVRRSAVITYVGGIALLFAVIGAGMAYWSLRDKDRVDPTMPQAVGTVGSAPGGHRTSPGGGDPAGRPDETRDELERRGAGGTSQGPMPPLRAGAALTEISDLFARTPNAVAGQAVDVRDVEIISTEGRMFWIRDDSAKVAVVAPAADAPPATGRKADVRGVAEPDGNGGVRIRAERIEMR
jgi:hypothetical protein